MRRTSVGTWKRFLLLVIDIVVDETLFSICYQLTTPKCARNVLKMSIIMFLASDGPPESQYRSLSNAETTKPFRGASVDWIEFGEFDALRQGLIKHVHSTFHCEIVQTQSKRVKVNNECGIKWIDINCACIVSLIDEALKAALNLPSAQLIMYRCCHQTTAISTLPQCPRDSKLCCIAKRCKLIFKLAWTNIKRGYKSKPQYESALAVYIESILGDTSYSSI